MMRTALVVMADILVLVVALLAVTEFHALRRFNTFTVPFTDRLIACGAIQPENRQRVMELLRRYGLAEFAHKRPGQLSGGMRQRCAMIRTLAVEPRILLLDEPFSALDYQTRLAVSADIHAILRREGQTALMVTHDIAEAVSMSDRVFVLSRRPAVVKTVHDLSPLRDLTPLQRRDHPSFHIHFNAIWKELDIHV